MKTPTLDALEQRCAELTNMIRTIVADDDFDPAELLIRVRLLAEYSHALDDMLLYGCGELADDLLCTSIADQLTNAI